MKTIFDRIAGMTADQRVALSEQFDKASRVAGAEPVAVVGIGCRFPGGVEGPERYWDLLDSGTDAIGEVPSDRWDGDAFYDADPLAPGRMPTKWGGFLPDIRGFDADFFGISPREAVAMDPQQRVLLEVAWEALEHSGIAPDQLSETQTAVMMGVYYTEYQNASAGDPDTIDAYSATGNAHSVTVGRISYLLGLRGPAVAVDTACSSSLVSIHLACQSLRMRESDLALAGGVSLNLRPETQLALAKWGMLSPRGRCHAFDSRADGFVRGEGAGVVVLKRLTDAVRDGDRVLAVVRGSAVNQDGRSNGLTAPNAPSQRDVIKRALRSADVTAASVNFIETHGTGTALGDPIEFDALAAVYGRGDGPCALGAVKTNMGHLEAAAGIAGFIKTVLSLQRAHIPPNLHFAQWNPAIDHSATRLFVPTESAPWPAADGPRRAAVSSFGMGGTNAHIVLEQGPDASPVEVAAEEPVTTLVVSAKTAQRVASTAGALADWLDAAGADAPLSAVANGLNHHRSRFGTLAAVCARDRAEAVAGLRALASGKPAPGVVAARDASRRSGTVFLYSGQGAQWPGMGRQLLADEPAFAAAVAELDPIFVEKVGFSLHQVLDAGEPVTGIDRIQPVLVGMQLALTELWRSYGVEPDAVIGHSMGEVTAAVVAGALTPAEGLEVIATRSRLMSRLSGQGAMALLELDAAAAEKLTAEHAEVTVAVYASPRQTVVAGPPEQVDALIAIVDGQGRLARRIEVDVASHHPTIDPILPELRTALAHLAPVTPKIPVISTTGHTGPAPMFGADYWLANLRNPVRFSQAVGTAGADHAVFVEISPHPLLTHAISDTLAAAAPGKNVHVGATVNRDHPETLAFHTQLAAVRPPAFQTVDPEAGGAGLRVDIPPTPWLHSTYWMTTRSGSREFTGSHPLLGMHVELPAGTGHVWQGDVGTEAHPWMDDHEVHGQAVMPGAGFAEMALAAGCEALGLPMHAVEVLQLDVEQMLALDTQTRVTTQLVHASDATVGVEIHSHSPGGSWTRHAVATLSPTSASAPTDPSGAPAADGETISPSEFYTALRRTGAHHGRAFAPLTRIVRASGWSETEIVLPDEATPHRGMLIHPVMLDAALQGLAAAMPGDSRSDAGEATYLPVGMESIRVYGEVGRRARCRAEIISVDDVSGDTLGRVTLRNEAGRITARVSGVRLRRIQRRTVPLPLSQKLFDTVWLETPIGEGDAVAGSFLLLTDGAGAGAAVADFTTGFESPSRRVVTADLGDESAVLEAFATAAADPDLPPAGVVVFVEPRSFDGTDAAAEQTHARNLIWSLASTVRAITGGWHGKAPRLFVVSRDGLVVTGSDDAGRGNPAVGTLRGLIRVLAYEHPDLRATVLDLDAPGDAVAAFTAELAASTNDDVIAWRDGRRYVERLSRATLPAVRREPVVRGDASYVVTGGLGGVGLKVAGWLVAGGAGRVVLNGRRGPSEEVRRHLDELGARTEIVTVLGDVSEPGVAERLVAAAEATGRPLGGILHSAAVLEDQLVAGLTRESLDQIWAPKATGAVRLHEATEGRELDWWVGFSSVVSLLGSPGQAAYACANAWLDGLVEWRRAAGLPATSIHWGQWSDVGLAREMTFSALDPITPDEGLEALDGVLAAGFTRVGVARLRLDRAADAFPEIRQLGYFTNLVEELHALDADDDWGGPDALRELAPEEASRVITARLRKRISAIMGYAGDSAIETDQALTELGMDSLMAVRMRNTVRGDFGVEPPVALILQGASLADLALDLVRQLGLTEQDPGERPNAVRDRAQQRAAARQRAASRRKAGQR